MTLPESSAASASRSAHDGDPPLRRRPASRDPSLDGLRGVAVLMVFIFHYGGGLRSANPIAHLLGVLTEAGWIGVVLFFALSGFLITGSLWDSMDEPHRLRNFYARRALRILPLYYAVILACALLSVARGSRFAELRPFESFVFFLQDLPFLGTWALQNPSPLPLYHLWSLAVEEQFYLAWPLLLFSIQGRRGALRLSLSIFAICAFFRLAVYGLPALAFARHARLFDSFLLTHAGALALGAAAAMALRGSRSGQISASAQALHRHATSWFFLGLAIFLISSFFCRSFYLALPLQFMLGLPGISLACAALIPILLRPGIPRRIFAFTPLAWLGRISYGFYVFHILLQPLFDQLGEDLTHSHSGMLYQGTRLTVAFPLTVLAAWLSFHLLELPFLRRKMRFPMHQPLPEPGR